MIPRGRVDNRSNNESDNEEEEKPRKRRKLEPEADSKEDDEHRSRPPPKAKVELTQFQQEKLDLAKSKLSKWAARLFDPNRPRGLVEPPKT